MVAAAAAASPSDASRSARAAWLTLGVLVAAVTAAYVNTLAVPFLLDDIGAIAENPTLRRLWPLSQVLAPPANAGVGGRPVANLSFALNHAVGGLDVRGYHVVNLAIHVGATLALFGLVRRTLLLPRVRRGGPAEETHVALTAGAAALLWALHPLHTESVTYLSQRTESLMGLCYLATLYCYARATQEPGRGWAAAAFVACLLGMATKEIMVTAPVAALLYDRTFVSGSLRAAWQQHRRLLLALAAPWLLLLFLLADVRTRGVAHASVAWWEYALTSTRAILHYLRLAIWPTPLVFDYGTDVVRRAVDVWPQLLGLATLLGATLVAWWRRPFLGFAGAWFLLLLAPASSVVPVAGQTMAEHRMYLPLVPVVGAGAVALVRSFGPRALIAIVLAAGVLGGATVVRNQDYRDAVSLWTDTIQKRPDNARAHASLGAAHLARGELPAARGALERAVALDPRAAEAHNNLANLLVETGRIAEALPHFTAAAELRPQVASTHYNFGNALLALGRTDDAIRRQRQALVLRPDFPEAHCALANALAAAGQTPEAITHFRAALQLRPDLSPAHFGLANALTLTRRFSEAIPHYEATLRQVPDSLEARYNLAMALAQAGRVAEAIAAFERVLKARPDLEPAQRNLEALRRAAK